MVKRQKPNFFGICLNVPNDVLTIMLEYCMNRYCEKCRKYYPQAFTCLSCVTFHSLKFYTIDGFQESINYTRIFNHVIDQHIWNYVNETIGPAYSSSGVCWMGSDEFRHKLKLSVKRKRTRTSKDWWRLSLTPYGVEYGGCLIDPILGVRVNSIKKPKKHTSLTLVSK